MNGRKISNDEAGKIIKEAKWISAVSHDEVKCVMVDDSVKYIHYQQHEDPVVWE